MFDFFKKKKTDLNEVIEAEAHAKELLKQAELTGTARAKEDGKKARADFKGGKKKGLGVNIVENLAAFSKNFDEEYGKDLGFKDPFSKKKNGRGRF